LVKIAHPGNEGKVQSVAAAKINNVGAAHIASAAADDVCDEPSLNIRAHAKNECVPHSTKS
jgi:hypothetical protein